MNRALLPLDLRVQVFGPAYLDRVLHVDRSLHEPGKAPLDQSVDGTLKFGEGLVFTAADGSSLVIELPDDWPGPTGTVSLSSPPGGWKPGETRIAQGVSWHDDLGGMGAGYALALGGELVSALGSEEDPTSRAIAEKLTLHGIQHRPVRVADATADWTLLVTSGRWGDKLPVGFRGCHSAIDSLKKEIRSVGPCGLRVVAALPNRLAVEVLQAEGAEVRVFAPSTRNMADRSLPVSRFAGSIDLLCCNRREWEILDDREQVAWQVSVLVVTDGANGSVVRFTTPQGEAGRVLAPAFPMSHEPRDTNRAGESYAATLVASLLEGGWSGGVVEESLVRSSAERASASAALVINRTEFGFPTPAEIDAAVRAGRA